MPPRSSAAALSLADPDRIQALLREHFAFVWRCVRRFGVAEASVDDVVQETFIVVSRRLSDVEPGKERAFLTSTALYLSANWRRRHRRAPEASEEDALDNAASDVPSPEELSDRFRARALLDRALDALPLKLRAPFVLLEVEGLTRLEAAELLALPPGTVGTRVRLARERFEAEVRRLMRIPNRREGAG